jgi:hypothetical protein
MFCVSELVEVLAVAEHVVVGAVLWGVEINQRIKGKRVCVRSVVSGDRGRPIFIEHKISRRGIVSEEIVELIIRKSICVA